MWTEKDHAKGVTPTDQCDWQTLKTMIAKHGVRNSLLIAPMPTASTAQILGNNESIEPYTSNIYSRRVLSGDYQVLCLLLLSKMILCIYIDRQSASTKGSRRIGHMER